MAAPKKLHSVPVAPVEIRRPSDSPKPATAEVLTGTKKTRSVAHALNGVIRDHSFLKPRVRDVDRPNWLERLGWFVLIAMLVFVSYSATTTQKPIETKTYPLLRN